MAEIIELTEQEKQVILEAREKKEKELAEQLEKERLVRIKQQANMEDEKARYLKSRKYELEKVENAYNNLHSELTKLGLQDCVKMEIEGKKEKRNFRTWNKDLPYIEYEVNYNEARIYLIGKDFHIYDKPEVRKYTTSVTVKGDLVKCYSITDNNRFIRPETLARQLKASHVIADSKLKEYHEKHSKLDNLLIDIKERFGRMQNVESIEKKACYNRSSSWDSICITFKSRSCIYVGYRYSHHEEPQVLKVEDRHEYERKVEDWAEMFSKQEKI